MAKKTRTRNRRISHRKNGSGLKSSTEARRLIRAALRVKRNGQASSYRDAARLLRLPNHGQLVKMLRGEIRDTPAMQAALARAEQRATRAYYCVRADRDSTIDVEVLRQQVEQLQKQIDVIRATLAGSA